MLRVAVGVLARADRVLLAQRPPGVHLAGQWEFPGGKRAPGESARQALHRELHEEVGVEVVGSRRLIRVIHHYPERSVELDVWLVTEWSGDPRGREGQPLEWVARGDLHRWDLPAADGPIVDALNLPPLYLITPEPDLGRDTAAFEASVEGALDSGVGLVQLRIKQHWDQDSREPAARLVQSLARRCARHGARLLLNVPSPLQVWIRGELDLDAAGIGCHLSGMALRAVGRRPAVPLLGVSCHDADELARAESVGADLIVLGPVAATASHPGAAVLGWDRFERLTSGMRCPVYALGGMTRADLDQAWARGGQGIAAIRSLWGPR